MAEASGFARIAAANLSIPEFDQRSVSLAVDVNQRSAVQVVNQLLRLNAKDPHAPIKLFIDSPGGRVDQGLWIYDVMQAIEAPVWTICTASAASMAALLLMAGEPGHRYAYPHSEIMLHMLSGSANFGGTPLDWQRQTDEFTTKQTVLDDIIRKHCGAGAEQLIQRTRANNTAHDVELSPAEAQRLGVIDRVLDGRGAARRTGFTPRVVAAGSGRLRTANAPGLLDPPSEWLGTIHQLPSRSGRGAADRPVTWSPRQRPPGDAVAALG